MGGHHPLHPAVLPQLHQMGGVAVGDVAHRVLLFRAQLVGDAGVLAVEVPALQGGEGLGLQGLLQCQGGPAGGLPGEEGLAGGGGVPRVGGDGGVGLVPGHLLRGQAGGLAGDLHHDGAQPLADAGRRGAHVDHAALHMEGAPAGVRDAHPQAGVFDGTGDARLGVGLVVGPQGVQHLHHGGGLVGDLPVGQGLAGADGVAVADLKGGDTHQLGQQVQVAFGGKAALGHAEAPEGAGGGVVGVVGLAVDVDGLEVVGPGGVGAGPLEHRPAQGGKGPGVREEGGLQGGEDAVFVAGGGELHLKGVALGVAEEGLVPAHGHLHRFPGEQGQDGGVVLDAHVLLAAEAAAHHHGLDPNLVGGEAGGLGALLLGLVDALVGRPDDDPVPVRGGHGALGLQEGVLGGGRVVLPGHHVFGGPDGCVGVPPDQVLVGEQVAPVLNLGGVGGHGLPHREDGGQGLILHLHQGLGLVEDLPALGGDENDGVPPEVDLSPHGDQDPLVLLQVAHLLLAGQVGGGDHLHHPGKRGGLTYVHGLDDGPGVLAAHRAAVEHAGQMEVVGVRCGTQGLCLGVHPMEGLAHLAGKGEAGHLGVFPEEPGGQEDRILDFLIPRAAADVVAQGELDLLPAGVGVLVQKALGAHHHARGAEAALHRPAVGEGVGVHVLLPVGEALAGHHRLALHFGGALDAGLGGLPVDEDGAGAAGPLLTAVLYAGEPQLLPEEVDELFLPVGGHGFAVYLERKHGEASFCLMGALRPVRSFSGIA